ncbi:MAG: oligosaccharide flippase family protein [Chitinophagales bacterium]
MNTSEKLFKNFTTLFIGLILVQVINFSFSLILPKFFSPTQFAQFGIFTSVVFILIELINAKLDLAVMLGKTDEEAKEIVNAAVSVACILSIIIACICVPVVLLFDRIYFLLPLIVLLYGIHQPILVYLNKQEHYKAINVFRIIQVLSTSISTLILIYFHIQTALLLGFFIGLLCATIYVSTFVSIRFSFETVKQKIKEYDQFPKFGTWSSLLNNFSRNSIPILLVQFFSQQMVGFYSYATRLLNAPTGMYTSAVSQVYFKMASETKQDELKKQTHKIILFSFMIGIIPTLIFLFFGETIFYLLFSGEWLAAGKIAQYFILWYFLGIITGPISFLLDIKNKLKFEFYYNVIFFLARIIAICIGALYQDFYLSILLFSITGVVMNVYLLWYINFQLLNHD